MFKVLFGFYVIFHITTICRSEEYEPKVLGNDIPPNLDFAERYYQQSKMQPYDLPLEPIIIDDGRVYQVQRRNSELSSALMQLYGSNKFYGKRNPDMSRALLSYISGELSNKARM